MIVDHEDDTNGINIHAGTSPVNGNTLLRNHRVDIGGKFSTRRDEVGGV